jgi:hypothetical protein
LEEVAEDFHFPFIPQDLFYRYKLKWITCILTFRW